MCTKAENKVTQFKINTAKNKLEGIYYVKVYRNCENCVIFI